MSTTRPPSRLRRSAKRPPTAGTLQCFMVFFHELDLATLKKKQIFLDIDGTLLCDAQWNLSANVEKKARELRKWNLIWLCSNGKDKKRNAAVARRLGVKWLDTPFQKPSRKMIPYLPATKGQKRVVIGDRYLTDGLFAERIGAEFIKVSRLRGPTDGWKARWLYVVDDLAVYCRGAFKTVIKWRP